MVVITGMNPKRWVKPGEKAHWRIIVHVRVGQEIRPYTSVHVDWTHRSLVFVNMPLPLPRTGDGAIGLDRGCVHTLASSDGTFEDMPKPSKAELKRLKYLQRRMARQDHVNEARSGRTAKFVSKRRRKTLSRFIVRAMACAFPIFLSPMTIFMPLPILRAMAMPICPARGT